MAEKSDIKTIDAYIAQFEPDIQKKLQTMRETIKSAAPEASEKISYAMPTFYHSGNLVHFAAFKNHIGFYPGAEGIEAFKDMLDGYSFSKGAVQFPHEKPLPLGLVTEIVHYRVGQNKDRAQKKKTENKAIN